jgi:serine/threonine-protein kinase
MTAVKEPILTQLAEQGVLSPDDAAKVQATLDSSELVTNAKDLADQLVRLDKLTPYQAKTLAAGEVKNLVLGNYVLLDHLGEGGMGRVYKARHRGMDRIVAIKMLLPEKLGSKSGLKRFSQEVKAAARLTHPNIVAAFDADLEGEVPYLVMEYVDGDDLQTILAASGKLPIDEAVDCIRQAARGLAYAHSVGIIHRDIKPGNLLVDKQGTVRILDMGVAQLRPQIVGDQPPADIHTQLTRDGAVIGTVDFMAPEQAASARAADERSDIYSLGCTLYFLLTNEPVFRAESVVDRLIAHRQKPIPSLRAARPDVPPALDAIFQCMVAKDPVDRYANMTELLAALDSLPSMPKDEFATVAHEASPTQSSAPASREIEWVDDGRSHDVAPARRRLSATTLALLVLGVLFLGITAFFAYDAMPGSGSLEIELSEPDANIVVVEQHTRRPAANEQATGQLAALKLPAGDYEIMATKQGFKTKAFVVSVRAWERRRVEIDLEPDESFNLDDLVP